MISYEIFNKQIDLHIYSYRDSHRKNSLQYLFVYKYFENQFDREVLESVVKKCPNISRVYLSDSDNDVSSELITNYCRRVTKLEVTPECRAKCLMSFANKHDMWLKLSSFNLKEISVRRFSDYSDDFVKEFLQKVQNIKKIKLGYGTHNDKQDH